MLRYFMIIFFQFLVIFGVLLLLFNRSFSSTPGTKQTYVQLAALQKEQEDVLKGDKRVLGESISPSPLPRPTMLLTLLTTPVPLPTQPIVTVIPDQSNYTISLIGDSMVDTMGEVLEYLEHELVRKYPNTNFNLYNYGIGSQNVKDAYERFDEEFHNNDRNYPPLNQIHSDILIIGSFAYNPFSPHNIDLHTEYLDKIIEKGKNTSDQVYLLAEMAPTKVSFGQGPGGVNWGSLESYQQATNIISLLENTQRLGKKKGIPLINVYNQTIVKADKSGDPKYINTHDNIHPSIKGHEFMAKVIVDTIKLD